MKMEQIQTYEINMEERMEASLGLQDLTTMALSIVVLAVVVAVGFLIISKFQQTNVVSGDNDTKNALNSIKNDVLKLVVDLAPVLVIVGIAALIIYVIYRYFQQ